jgi:tripartite-type tricarboxylate transporter receptor subunit TctC
MKPDRSASSLRALRAATLAPALLLPAAAHAQDWPAPNRPLRLLVGFPPGGSTDLLARNLAAKLSEQTGAQVLIDNRAGAAGNLASELTARANPDGYTLLMATVSSHAINPAIYRKLSFDPIRDFTPVSQVASYPLILAVNPAVGAKSVKDLLAVARAKPGALNFSSSGNGSPGHLAGELFKMLGGVQMTHVPYKGGAPATAAVLSNEAQLIFATLPAMIGFVKSGKLIGMGMTTARRSPAMPDVPTIAEAGVPKFEVSSWAGIVGPAGMPRERVAQIHAAIVRALGAADLRDRLASEGAEAIGSAPSAFAAFRKAEAAQWARVVREAKAQVD